MIYAIRIVHYLWSGCQFEGTTRRLGHSDVTTTMNIYAHVTKKAKEEAILKFASYIEV